MELTSTRTNFKIPTCHKSPGLTPHSSPFIARHRIYFVILAQVRGIILHSIERRGIHEFMIAHCSTEILTQQGSPPIAKTRARYWQAIIIWPQRNNYCTLCLHVDTPESQNNIRLFITSTGALSDVLSATRLPFVGHLQGGSIP